MATDHLLIMFTLTDNKRAPRIESKISENTFKTLAWLYRMQQGGSIELQASSVLKRPSSPKPNAKRNYGRKIKRCKKQQHSESQRAPGREPRSIGEVLESGRRQRKLVTVSPARK
jgi:hypothetical protein